MSRRKYRGSEAWYWDGCPETLRGNGMTLEELQKRYPENWKVVRVSKRGNRLMSGEYVKGYDNYGGSYYGGKAFATYVTAVVRPNDEVAEYTLTSDEWDY